MIAGYPKLPYPKLKIRICDVSDNVGTSKEEPETHQNNVFMLDTMQPFFHQNQVVFPILYLPVES